MIKRLLIKYQDAIEKSPIRLHLNIYNLFWIIVNFYNKIYRF